MQRGTESRNPRRPTPQAACHSKSPPSRSKEGKKMSDSSSRPAGSTGATSIAAPQSETSTAPAMRVSRSRCGALLGPPSPCHRALGRTISHRRSPAHKTGQFSKGASMSIPARPGPTHRRPWRLAIAVVAMTATATLLALSHDWGSSGTTSTPAVSVQIQPAIPHLDPIPSMPAVSVPAGSDSANPCAGISDALGEHGGPSPRGAGVSDPLGEHGGPSPRSC